MSDLEYIAFMCACEHKLYDYLEETLKEYAIGKYLMAAEVTKDSHSETNGEHFHFLVQMTDADYHKYSKRCFKDKLKLRGKAIDGKPRQYGRVKQIENIDRMAAYTIKQGNIRTNMTEAQLNAYKQITFESKEEKNFEDELYSFLLTEAKYGDKSPLFGQRLTKTQDIGLYIVKFVRNYKTKIHLGRNKLTKLIDYYQLHYLKEEMTDEKYLEICLGL